MELMTSIYIKSLDLFVFGRFAAITRPLIVTTLLFTVISPIFVYF